MSLGWDVLIVGGGAAGCVLAARLSQDPQRSVLLLEAGPDLRVQPPADIADGFQPTMSYDWGYAEVAGPDGSVRPLPRGRLLGGCSATNATFALRGHPADYDAWAAAGNVGWSFADVLPDFTRLESDADLGRMPWHGDQGPLPIRRYGDTELTDVATAGEEMLTTLVGGWVSDLNAPGALGAGRIPVNCLDGRRISTALAYLPADRPNLEIRCAVEVDGVLTRSARAVGVRLLTGELLEADRVVLSAGAYGTPAVLMRSGIGPADHLRSVGVPPVLDLPGVGSGLADHPAVSVLLAHPAGVSRPAPMFQVAGTARSPFVDPTGPPDLQYVVSGPWPSNGSAVSSAAAALLKPRSRGTVRLRSGDPMAPPLIDLGYFRDPGDLDRLAEALSLVRAACQDQPMKDISAGVELSPGTGLPQDDAASTRSWIRRHAWTYHHPVGTAAMGPDPSAGAVVDATGRVHGLRSLWVIDASVMPDIPSANTHLPTVMVAEHLAAVFDQ